MKKIISCLFAMAMLASVGLNASALTVGPEYYYKYYVKVAPETSESQIDTNGDTHIIYR